MQNHLSCPIQKLSFFFFFIFRLLRPTLCNQRAARAVTSIKITLVLYHAHSFRSLPSLSKRDHVLSRNVRSFVNVIQKSGWRAPVSNRTPRAQRKHGRARVSPHRRNVSIGARMHAARRQRLLARKSIGDDTTIAAYFIHWPYSPVTAGVYTVGCFREQRYQRLSVPGHVRFHGHPAVCSRTH